MCPLCIGSALLALGGASSAGGLALIAARVANAGNPKHPGDLRRPGNSSAQDRGRDRPGVREPDR